MALGRQKLGAGREPEPPASPISGPRPGAQDRAPKRQRRRGRGSRGGRSPLRRLFYWALVLGLWVVIAVGGVLALAAANLPPIQSLEIPKRPPSIEIVGLDG